MIKKQKMKALTIALNMITVMLAGCGKEQAPVQIDAETAAMAEASIKEDDGIGTDSLSGASSIYNEDEYVPSAEVSSGENMAEDFGNNEDSGSGADFGTSEMDYIELPILSGQIKIAGYSIDDGNRTEEIMQRASEIMPICEGYMGNYTGWCYDEHLSWDKAFLISYLVRGNGNTCISYKYGDDRISLKVDYYDYEAPIQEYPLIESTIPLLTGYEEVLDILHIKELVKLTEEKGEPLGDFKISYQFNSQYGPDTWCVICSTDLDVPLSDSNDFSIALYITNGQSLWMQFLDDQLVCVWVQKYIN